MPENLYFTVEEWSASGDFVRVIARSDNLMVTRGAFKAAFASSAGQS